MENHNDIFISQSYNVSAETIFDLIKSGMLFELTGADEINFDFWEGGAFHLIFKDRGHIDGTFIEIIPTEKVLLNWNVEGFDKPAETDTQVSISVEENEDTTVTIEHSRIKNDDAAAAKKKAWMEVLHDLNERINEAIPNP